MIGVHNKKELSEIVDQGERDNDHSVRVGIDTRDHGLHLSPFMYKIENSEAQGAWGVSYTLVKGKARQELLF